MAIPQHTHTRANAHGTGEFGHSHLKQTGLPGVTGIRHCGSSLLLAPSSLLLAPSPLLVPCTYTHAFPTPTPHAAYSPPPQPPRTAPPASFHQRVVTHAAHVCSCVIPRRSGRNSGAGRRTGQAHDDGAHSASWVEAVSPLA